MKIPSALRALFKALVLRPLFREKVRSTLTILGIAVGVAVLVAIALANNSAMRSFEESVDAVAGRANYQIISDAGPIDEALVLKLQFLWVEGGRFAPVIDVEGSLLPGEVPVRFLGVDLLSDLHFRDYRYARIETPEPSLQNQPSSPASFLQLFQPDSVVVPESFATQHRLQIGSRVVVSVADRQAGLTVRGILRPEGPATAFNGSLIVLDIATAQEAFGMGGTLSRVDLMIPKAKEAALVQQIQRVLPANARLERPSRRNERVGKMLRAFRVNLFALGGVALLVGMFLVYNTVLISVLRRRRDLGILTTLGASRAEIIATFVAEGALFGLVGSVAGIGLGYGLARSILGLVSRTINALYVTTSASSVALTPGVVATALALGVGVSVLAALQPSIEAGSVSPLSLIRPGRYQRVSHRQKLRLVWLSLPAFIAAFLLTRLDPVLGIPVGGYAAVIFVVVAFSLLAPATLLGGGRLMRPLLRRLFPVSGQLASAAIPASLRRTSTATAALAVAIGMMVAVSVMVGSFRETVRQWVGQTVQADLWLRPARGIGNSPNSSFAPSIVKDLTAMPFVAAVDPFSGREMTYADSIVALGSGDFSVAAVHGDLPMVTPRNARIALSDAIRQNGVVVSESFSLKFGKSRGDVIAIPTQRGLTSFPVTGVYRDYSNDRGVIVMHRPLYVREFGEHRVGTVSVYLEPGTSPETARVAIEKALGRRHNAFGFTNATIRREVMRIFDQTFTITYALLVIALVVAVLGVINTMAALILERRGELALLRVLGTTVGQIRTSVVLESFLTGLAATVLGVLSGFILSLILIFVINKQSFGWTIELNAPGWSLLISLIVTLAATVVAGLVPARLAGRVDLATELKSD